MWILNNILVVLLTLGGVFAGPLRNELRRLRTAELAKEYRVWRSVVAVLVCAWVVIALAYCWTLKLLL